MDKNGLEKALVDILQKAVSGVEKGVGFLQAELPEVIEQLLIWNMIKSILCNITFFIFAAMSAYFIVKNKGILYEKMVKIEQRPVFIIPFVFVLISFILFLLLFNLTWLQILIAPKLYLIEYAAELKN